MKTWIIILLLGIATSHGAEIIALSHKLDPNTIIYDGKEYIDPDPKRIKFHSWYVNETKRSIDPEIVVNFLAIIDDDNSFEKMSIMCFQPGFGFSITKDGKVYDYLICFHCSNMRFFVDGDPITHKSTLTSSALLKLKEVYESIWGKAKLTDEENKKA